MKQRTNSQSANSQLSRQKKKFAWTAEEIMLAIDPKSDVKILLQSQKSKLTQKSDQN